MCNVSSGFYSVKWWQSEKENTGCGWRVEDVSSATAPSWEPSEAPVLTSGSLVQVQKSNQVTENTMRQPFPATSWPHPFSNQTLLFFQGEKIPCCFWPNKKRRKNKSQCSSRYLWVTVWAGLRRAMPRLHAVKPCSCRQGAAVAQWPQKCLARVRQIKPNTCSFPIFTRKAPREILEANT